MAVEQRLIDALGRHEIEPCNAYRVQVNPAGGCEAALRVDGVFGASCAPVTSFKLSAKALRRWSVMIASTESVAHDTPVESFCARAHIN